MIPSIKLQSAFFPFNLLEIFGVLKYSCNISKFPRLRFARHQREY